MWNETTVVLLEVLCKNFPGGTEETNLEVVQESRCLGRYSERTLFECKSDLLLLEASCSECPLQQCVMSPLFREQKNLLQWSTHVGFPSGLLATCHGALVVVVSL
jgi:hypothetical protein